jgi:hypothetical protein
MNLIVQSIYGHGVEGIGGKMLGYFIKCLYFCIFAKIMLPMLKLDTNYGFYELFLKYKQDDIIQMLVFFNRQHICPVLVDGYFNSDWHSNGNELCSVIHRFVSTCL